MLNSSSLTPSSDALQFNVSRKLSPLLGQSRYKGAHGGRGGAKSHFFAEYLIARCYGETTRAACIREVQNSIKDSVRQLLIDKIAKFDLGGFFTPVESEIRGANGSLIIFKGMQSYNAENIKSLEGFDIAWVEEAQTLSHHSLKMLRPTLRKEGSELWFSWNPRHDDDAVDEFFRARKPADALCVEVGWQDNPWFPDVLRREMEDDYAFDPEVAEHVWGGGYDIISESAYFARLIHAIEKNGQIGFFPYDPDLPVYTAWDIGVDDYTAIWFLQQDGHNVYVIDYYEASGLGAEPIVKEALPELDPDVMRAAAQMLEIGRDEPYTYKLHYLPHDVKNREWGAGGRERSLILNSYGVKPLNVGVSTDPANRIEAVRRILPICHFNDTKRVQLGLKRLRRYSRRLNESMQTYTGPLHDINSHGADAFGEFAINCGIAPTIRRLPEKPQPRGTVVLEGPPVARSGNRIRI